jgi:transcriptional regulator with XRE-family HTH domain
MKKRTGDPRDVEIGRRIRALRLQRGLSQSDLGDFLDVTFQQVQKYEKGTNRIGASRLQQIALVLSVPVAFFFEGAPAPEPAAGMSEPVSAAYVSDFLATSDGLALTRAFMKVRDARVRRRIVDLVESIAADGDV